MHGEVVPNITELGEKIYFTTKYTFPLYIQNYMYKTVNVIFMLQFTLQKTEYFYSFNMLLL